ARLVPVTRRIAVALLVAVARLAVTGLAVTRGLLVTVLPEAVLARARVLALRLARARAEAVLTVPVLAVGGLGAVSLVLAFLGVRGEAGLPEFRLPVFRRWRAVGRRALTRRTRPGPVARLIAVALLVIVVRPGRTGGF